MKNKNLIMVCFFIIFFIGGMCLGLGISKEKPPKIIHKECPEPECTYFSKTIEEVHVIGWVKVNDTWVKGDLI